MLLVVSTTHCHILLKLATPWMIGVPPKLIPHFSVDGALVENAENAEQALTDLEGNIIGTTLFKALFKAATLQQKIVINGMSFSRLEIQLGLVPAVRLCYKQQ